MSPYVRTVYNDDKIDIPLDFSVAEIKISTNINNIAFTGKQIIKSLLTAELGENYHVQTASIFGSVKYNGVWKGIRINAKMK